MSAFFAKNQAVTGNALALISTLLWSGNLIAAKILSPELSAVSMVFWRWVAATLVMLPLGFRAARASWPVIRAHWRLLASYGLVGMCAASLGYYEAPKTSSAVNMAMLAGTAPLFMMFYSRVLFGEPVTRRRLLCAAVALVGVAVLVTRGHITELAHINLAPGDLWLLAGSACFSWYSVTLRWFKAEIPIQAFLLIVFAFGLAGATPPYLWSEHADLLPAISTQGLLALLFIGVAPSCLAFLCWSAAIARIGAVRAGLINYLLPVFGSIEAVLLLGESLDAAQLMGGALVLGGVVLSALPRKGS